MATEFEIGELPLDNDWMFWYEYRSRSTTTRRLEPNDTLTLTAFFAATDAYNATPIDGALSVTLTLVAAGTGAYHGAVGGDVLTEKLTAYLGKTIYEIVKDGTRVRSASPFRVVATRRPSRR